ncbi:MAG: FAD:protein FMN transferase [Candidatus Omnitrophota bacterium]|jgi:thiamine biosynthesis lipoprotein|nr:FAD:protein FMN transferase [Candidatus Omnitrophota bacterium]
MTIGVLLLASASGCQKPLYQETQFIMGTFVEVKSSDVRASAIVFDEFKKLEAIFNLFDRGSELSRLNDTQKAVVSEPLFDIIQQAQGFYRLTDGAFDITVGPASVLWKKAIASKILPGPDAVAQALSLAGSDFIYLDAKTREVALLKSGMRIDLGGIAKGFALDRAVRKLKDAQIDSALINAGGNIYCLGTNHRAPWRVGIQDPFREGKVLDELVLADRAVATAGDYQQYVEINGRRYSHIVDPKTGYPAQSGIISATIIADDATASDALSTACVVLGLEKSRKLLSRFPEMKAILVANDGTLYRI